MSEAEEVPPHLRIFQDDYGRYSPCENTDPVPDFPCAIIDGCTPEDRRCEKHLRTLYVREADGHTFSIPFGVWESFAWYKERIREVTGYLPEYQKIIFAGCEPPDFKRHSGLQKQTTLSLLYNPPAQVKSARRVDNVSSFSV